MTLTQFFYIGQKTVYVQYTKESFKRHKKIYIVFDLSTNAIKHCLPKFYKIIAIKDSYQMLYFFNDCCCDKYLFFSNNIKTKTIDIKSTETNTLKNIYRMINLPQLFWSKEMSSSSSSFLNNDVA